MLRLLVLSAATHVGQNVLATLAPRRAGHALIATSSVANEPALFDYDAVHLVPPTAADPAAFEAILLDLMERERIDLVIPCREAIHARLHARLRDGLRADERAVRDTDDAARRYRRGDGERRRPTVNEP